MSKDKEKQAKLKALQLTLSRFMLDKGNSRINKTT